MRKRLLAIVAAAAMVVAMMPSMVFAAPGDVAQIGTATYPTLQAAVNAAKDGDTIILLDDIEFTKSNAGYSDGYWYNGIRYEGDKSFTIDLAGKTITDKDLNDHVLNFINKGSKKNEITLKNGTINGGPYAWTVISVGASSATYPTVINLGKDIVVNGDGSANTGEDCVARCRNGSTLNVLDGATITSTSVLYCVAGGSASDDNTATLNIYDGAKIDNNCTESGAIAVMGTSIVNIYGGTITSEGVAVHTATSGSPKFTISGGKISGKKGAVISSGDYGSYPDAAPVINITGGTFEGEVKEVNHGTPAVDKGAELTVAGGTFDSDVTDYLVSECVQDKNTGVVTNPNAPAAGGQGTTTPEKSPNTGDNSMAPIAVAGLVMAAMAAVVATRRRTN